MIVFFYLLCVYFLFRLKFDSKIRGFVLPDPMRSILSHWNESIRKQITLCSFSVHFLFLFPIENPAERVVEVQQRKGYFWRRKKDG